jgi:hypothetical protein
MSEVDMNRVQVLYALAECMDNTLIKQDIETVSGKLDEAHIKELESIILEDVNSINGSDDWPPKKS